MVDRIRCFHPLHLTIVSRVMRLQGATGTGRVFRNSPSSRLSPPSPFGTASPRLAERVPLLSARANTRMYNVAPSSAVAGRTDARSSADGS